MKFELTTMTKGRCTNVNFKSQKHVDHDIMAVYLNINFDLPNTVLDQFDPKLRQKLYFSRADDQGQQVVAGVDQILPNLNFPHMEPFGWTTEMNGCTIDVDYGLGQEGDSNLWLEACKVCKWKLTPKEGGTVNVALQIQNCTDQLTTDMCGKLSGLFLAPYIEMRILAPEPAAQTEATSQAGSQAQGGEAGGDDDNDTDGNPFGDNLLPKDPPLTAGDIFANTAAEPAASTVPVTVKKTRRITGNLGTDADQAARQAQVLAEADAQAAGASVH